MLIKGLSAALVAATLLAPIAIAGPVDVNTADAKTLARELQGIGMAKAEAIVSYREKVVERFTPVDGNTINYQATITDPVVYTRPWSIAYSLTRSQDELLEVACREDNDDLEHLKKIKEAQGR